MASLTNRIALVTGASRGIGKAIALALAAAGADIAINYHKQSQAANEVAAEIKKLGRRCLTIQADVSDSAQVDRLFIEIEKNLDTVDILVNNAGIASALSPAQITEVDWHETIRVNLTSVFLVTQRALPAMREKRWGRIINISSVAAQYGGIVGPHYSASKAGILGLTRSYASFAAKEGITVNAIAPALIETDMIASLPALTPDRLPVGHYGSADEVARIAVLLAESSFITGQTINPNGGVYFT
ncbi:MAG TPA: SDR family NAD(P)-dependent oxidoreductase [Verrucomicrobiae bacterium]|nr:SDR family NAD(P)-dependent oxidoreductase [Verrucomicrobiae bacterium]